ncbi:PucR family transcriptional regulator [Pseudonocardia sp. GCM10023141]|uniref:PucR family transcriptional regulator n=1 Tax=Pseudonocardia sp. GCM10023141 TaxID=3252653 RepID=UPI00362057B8
MEATVRRLLAAIGEPLVDVLVAPAGLDVAVTGLAIVDPDDEPDDHAGRLVLVIGARGRSAERAVRGVARGGAVAVAVKAGPGAARELRAVCTEAGVALLAVRDDARWDHVEQLARSVIEEAGGSGEAAGDGDLFALAQTIGMMAGGLVIIEDAASRVLAYSRSDDAAADELRRLSILGWQGPADYLQMLREWGVFDRVRTGEDVVHVDEHAELGIRRRLAIGIHAGQRWLGTIWVQEGAQPFAEHAERALVGAARVAAGHLVRRRSQRSPGTRWSHDLVVGLLDGRVDPELVAATFGLDVERSAVVAGFAVRSAPGGAHAFGVAELADVVSVHAATYRRRALTASDGAHVYAVLPDVPLDRTEPGLRAMCAEVVTLTARRAGVRVQAGIGSAAASLAGIPASRVEADRVLAAMGEQLEVAALGDLRAEILLDGTLALLADAADLRDPAVTRLLAYDAEHGSELAESVVAYLDAMGDVRAAAARLTVHPNTLRYRLRRAGTVGGLDLDDPRARLVHHLQLLLALRSVHQASGKVAVRTNEPSAGAAS